MSPAVPAAPTRTRRSSKDFNFESEGPMLEAVELATEQDVDVNAANTDGRTALDAARALKYESVVAFLVAKGAKPGTP